jgi:hypothetical protein
MTGSSSLSPRVHAVQNGLAAALFASLLLAESLRHLLSAHPGYELLWRLSSLANWTVAPLLDGIANMIRNPWILLAVLAAGLAVPLASWRARSWLGTAASGHVCLGCLVVLAFQALKRNWTGELTASLSNVFDSRYYDLSATAFAVLAAVMLALCLANHVAFFRTRES